MIIPTFFAYLILQAGILTGGSSDTTRQADSADSITTSTSSKVIGWDDND